MTWILTNDDGIEAPGMRALAQAVQGQGMIVAPLEHQSGCGHQATTTQAIQMQQRSGAEFGCEGFPAYGIGGTPVDCVRIALSHLCPPLSQEVKLVLSGINAGANLGVDTYISGTVAAVREAAFHRIPGIAISQYRRGKRPIDWEWTAHWAAKTLAYLLNIPLEPGSFWNVNLPHLQPQDPDPEMIFCRPCTRPLPSDYRREGPNFHYIGEYAHRDRTPGSDIEICFSGQIAISKIQLQLSS